MSLETHMLAPVTRVRVSQQIPQYKEGWTEAIEGVVTRWQQVGAEVLTTGTAGAVGMRVCAHSGLKTVTQQRSERHRIWQE